MITLGVSVWVTPYITYELINKIKDIKNKLASYFGVKLSCVCLKFNGLEIALLNIQDNVCA